VTTLILTKQKRKKRKDKRKKEKKKKKKWERGWMIKQQTRQPNP
jgi:hypothetical protein